MSAFVTLTRGRDSSAGIATVYDGPAERNFLFASVQTTFGVYLASYLMVTGDPFLEVEWRNVNLTTGLIQW
jgi:hypothetical protein